MKTLTEIVLVVATARKGVIGKNNRLPWHLPEDLAHFRKLTTGHCIIMGRKTFESIGRALPNRRSIVISHRADALAGTAAAGIEWAGSLEAALALSQRTDTALPWPATPVFVIGGAQLYAQAMPIADRIEQTTIETDIDGDAWFPAIDPALWQLDSGTSSTGSASSPALADSPLGPQVSRTGLGYQFLSWHRKNREQPGG